ncbi:MAG TPA: lamin tail domain-containing protein [Flavobacteriaceae bacterium]|mgnify:CR=1 FL=1|nr:lamin tail domain-containing protein [Flavobacteriaceae bacterium]MCB9213156.1 lamin tail domain-containing protein [Alteromonas sp.]HPF10172.1 lamin tail domain-containing protein [Flavobacteriaceae bacterium]HQU21656.1 lamin tail domain-containing protein [Flavobacteriaceae bacterium]HQU65809.1 lamin tail domain-containing protein [Flavobacteriaceae bacterium]
MYRLHFGALMLLSITGMAQVGINTTTPSSSAVLDVASSNDGVHFGGMMIPRVSLSERDSIPATASDDGLMVYLSEGTTRCIQIWDAVDLEWEDVFCMPVNQAPVANNVQFTGNLVENETLTASFVYSDAEGDPAGSHTYTWYRADDSAGTNQTLVQTGTSNTFLLTSSEIGYYMALEVTPVATSGTSPGLAVLSAFDGPVNAPSTGGVFISEIADPDNDTTARFVEVSNGSSNAIDVSNWQVLVYFNGSTTAGGTYTFPSSTSIAGGTSYVIASDGTGFQNSYGFAADDVAFGFNSNGDDVFELRDDTTTLVDIYGQVGLDLTGTCGEFEDGRALRISTVAQGNVSWDESEWIVRADSTVAGCTDHANSPQNAPADFSPGTHPN